jgi:hypothetical protein
MSGRERIAAAVAVAVAVLSACTSAKQPAPTPTPSTQVITRTTTIVTTATPTPPPSFVPSPARTVAPLPPGKKPPAGEVEKRCPYIASTPAQNAKTNVADINGSHVYRTTVLTKLSPVGCRFYFYSGPYQAEVDIVPRTFPTALQAHNALALTSEAGAQAHSTTGVGSGIDAVLYRTKFFGPDGARDWACAFAKGTVLVIVHTDRTDTELNALLLAKAIAGRF